jgi:hypothetical protein
MAQELGKPSCQGLYDARKKRKLDQEVCHDPEQQALVLSELGKPGLALPALPQHPSAVSPSQQWWGGRQGQGGQHGSWPAPSGTQEPPQGWWGTPTLLVNTHQPGMHSKW